MMKLFGRVNAMMMPTVKRVLSQASVLLLVLAVGACGRTEEGKVSRAVVDGGSAALSTESTTEDGVVKSRENLARNSGWLRKDERRIKRIIAETALLERQIETYPVRIRQYAANDKATRVLQRTLDNAIAMYGNRFKDFAIAFNDTQRDLHKGRKLRKKLCAKNALEAQSLLDYVALSDQWTNLAIAYLAALNSEKQPERLVAMAPLLTRAVRLAAEIEPSDPVARKALSAERMTTVEEIEALLVLWADAQAMDR